MIKLAKIINEGTKQVELGYEEYIDFYTKKGFTENEVEQAYDGQWYLAGYAPVVPVPTYDQLRVAEYPPYTEYLDAQVKLGSGDLALATEGQRQLDAYVSACLAVKEKYPKAVDESVSSEQ